VTSVVLRKLRRLPRPWQQDPDVAPADTPRGRALRWLRWTALAVYPVFLAYSWHQTGVPFDRDRLLLWIGLGLACFCIGRHPVWLLWVAIDFAPFALVLVAYDYLRGLSDTVGMPTWWHPQLAVDTFLFAGYEPTIWLQEHLKHATADVRWYDLVVCVTYFSFFFLPYITAGVMWLRSRVDFYRWSLRFVSLSFLSFALFVLIPSAPPWAAALCTGTEVAHHPHDPSCLHYAAHAVSGNLLGPYTSHLAGANAYVERIAGQSFYKLHLTIAHALWTKGFNTVDAVAAVPSLHVGETVLFSMFMWQRLGRLWRPVLVGYPLLMQFSLTYSGEHYVADGIAGALCAVFIHRLATSVERRGLRFALEPGEGAEGIQLHEAGGQRNGVADPTGDGHARTGEHPSDRDVDTRQDEQHVGQVHRPVLGQALQRERQEDSQCPRDRDQVDGLGGAARCVDAE
jgi:PAP2 superfamily protein